MQKIGPYLVIDTIGQGGMGVVYKAQDPVLDRIVAIKALHPALLSEPEVVQRFLREAKTLAKFSHQNIVTLYTPIEEEDRFYLIMEYVEGETVKSMIDERGALPVEECVGIFLQVLLGMSYAHQLQVIHRDVKPGNVIITPEGRAKITDFGIAKVAGEVQLTQVGLRIGTLRYMSPEQINGQDATYACDIYALGVTFFEMLAGRVPFKADSQYELMRAVESEPPPPLRSFSPSIPEMLEQVILKALSKKPEERYSTAREFAEAIESAMGLPGALDRTGTVSTTLRRVVEGGTQTLRIEPPAMKSRKKYILPLAVLLVCATAAGTYMGIRHTARRDDPLVLAPLRGGSIDSSHTSEPGSPAPAEKSGSSSRGVERMRLPGVNRDQGSHKTQMPEHRPRGIPDRTATEAEKERQRSENIIIAHRNEKVQTTSHIESRGWIRVMSYPKGTVFINQKEAGSTPLGKREVPVGKYEIVVRSGDGEQKKNVTVRENETVDVSFVFSKE